LYFHHFRHCSHCTIVVKEDKDGICNDCAMLDKNMRIYKKRISNDGNDDLLRVTDSSHVNLRFLSKDELIQRLHNTQQRKRQAVRLAASLANKVQELTIREGIHVRN